MVKSPFLLLLFLAAPSAAKELSEADFLAELPVVLTASRLAQPAQDAPNAISVIDRAMIEASGFQSVPDLLRLVPGFYVGQINGVNFSVANAISAEYARQMQVLVDGRSVYLSSLGGVRWDALPLAIADIDRIEVVRGPNAAGYGANALTGIINIITRHPAEVEGRVFSATLGANGRQEALFRWAGGETHKQRVTLGWHQDTGFADINDSTHAPLLNYYGDFDIGPGQGLALQMGYIGGTRGAGSVTGNNSLSMPHDEHVSSHFQQIDYRRTLDIDQELLVKAYHNHQLGQETVPVGNPAFVPGTTYERDLMSDRWHGEVQWNQSVGETLRMTLGSFGRRDAVNSQHFFNRGDDLITLSWGTFAHVEWRLAPHWLLNTGAMWEDHELGGTHLSPRMALTWQPNRHHSVRIGASRAYRDPVQGEINADWQLTLPLVGGGTWTFVKLISNSSIHPEKNLSHEIGYLSSWPEYGLSFDARVYRDRLQGLIDIQQGTNIMANVADSVHEGVDAQLRWSLARHSFVMLNYAQLHIDTTHPQQQYFPEHVSGVLLSHRFSHGVDVSIGHYLSDAFVSFDKNRPPSYRRTDVRIAKEFKLEENKARLAFLMQHADGANYEYDVTPNKRVSRQGYVQFQLEF